MKAPPRHDRPLNHLRATTFGDSPLASAGSAARAQAGTSPMIEIDKAACETIEKHLAECSRCTAACESLKKTVSLCRALPGGDVPTSVKTVVRSALRRAGAIFPG